MTPPYYGLVQSEKKEARPMNALQWLPYGRKKIVGPQVHQRHVRRHILVDFLISAGGSLFAIAAIQRLVWAGVLAIICLFGGLLFDYRNIEDEEHEIEEAVHEGERSVKSN